MTIRFNNFQGFGPHQHHIYSRVKNDGSTDYSPGWSCREVKSRSEERTSSFDRSGYLHQHRFSAAQPHFLVFSGQNERGESYKFYISTTKTPPAIP
jgi:hypothetical protein